MAPLFMEPIYKAYKLEGMGAIGMLFMEPIYTAYNSKARKYTSFVPRVRGLRFTRETATI